MNDADFRLLKHLIEKVVRIEAQNAEILALLRKKKRIVKPRKVEYSDEFIEAWGLYPKRAGSNPKRKAFIAFERRITDGLAKHEEIYFELFQGIRKYANYCNATGNTGTEFVMQAATFFGPDKHYENDWTIPKPTTGKPAQPEIFSMAHQPADFSRDVENNLDTSQDPYRGMK